MSSYLSNQYKIRKEMCGKYRRLSWDTDRLPSLLKVAGIS